MKNVNQQLTSLIESIVSKTLNESDKIKFNKKTTIKDIIKLRDNIKPAYKKLDDELEEFKRENNSKKWKLNKTWESVKDAYIEELRKEILKLVTPDNARVPVKNGNNNLMEFFFQDKNNNFFKLSTHISLHSRTLHTFMIRDETNIKHTINGDLNMVLTPKQQAIYLVKLLKKYAKEFIPTYEFK